MKVDQVPQDDSPTYEGHKKLVYAVNNDGQYQGVSSSGWDVESYATQMAVDDLHQQTIDAFNRVKDGESSPLEYHMFKSRLDITSLQQATGFYQWQIKRHLKPKIFKNLNTKKLQRYCDVMGISLDTLQSLPEAP